MSLYNNYLYNQNTYNGSSLNLISISTEINGGSSASAGITYETNLNVSILCSSSLPITNLSSFTPISSVSIEGTSSVARAVINTTSGFGQVTTGTNDASGFVTGYISSIYGISAVITGSSEVRSGKILKANFIDNSGIFTSAAITVDNIINAEPAGVSTVSGYMKVDNIINAVIDASTDTSSSFNLGIIYKITADDMSSGGSYFDVLDLDVFDKITASDISGISTVTSQLHFFKGLKPIISGSSSVSALLSHSYSLGEVLINCSSTAREAVKLGSINFTRPRTRITATLRAPDPLRGFGERREVSFVFEVDKPQTNVSVVDKHYGLFRFYRSIYNLSSTLEYVRRSAQTELDSYDIYSEDHRKWTNGTDGEGGDLLNLTSGDRGIVQKDAIGIFKGFDGYFAIYKGPDIIVIPDEVDGEKI